MKNNLLFILLLSAATTLISTTCEAQGKTGAINANNPTVTSGNEVFGPVYHVVANGETAETIMKKFHMNRYQYNIWNPSNMAARTGAQIIVGYKWTKKNEGEKATAPATAQSNLKFHKVGPYETLFQLASAYHVSIQQLKDWNDISENTIRVGQNLIVGKTGQSEPSSPVASVPE